ncbi:hypothetical protein [Jiella pelagia]|uniref:Uncharacterized protein n=1 Tax=Jiella pelagia TaxID=2986949 RepID=A0ABY7C1V7_9HYPH|nr:hypothetical protein [Jiella pelagia]WAP69216.1 hypothetical protein OH818_02580 [Jiella pelagia]
MSTIETLLLLLITPVSALVIGALVLRDSRRITEQAHARAKARGKPR